MEFNWLEQNGDNFISTTEKKHTLKSVFGKRKLKQTPMDKEVATPIDLKMHCLVDDKQRTKLKSVVDALIAARKRGENVYYEVVPGMSYQSEFDKRYKFEVPAVRLYSADVTYQSALKAIKQRDEYEYGLTRAGESAEAKQLIAQNHEWELNDIGGRIEVLIANPALEKRWLKYVENCASCRNLEAVESLYQVMLCVNQGGTVKDVKRIMDATYGLAWNMVLDGIKTFCVDGKKLANDLMKLYKTELRQMQQNSVEKGL